GRREAENVLETAIMPIQPAPVTTEQNETEAVRPDDYQPSDLGPTPAGRAKLLIGAALLFLTPGAAVTFLNGKSKPARLPKKPEPFRFPPAAGVNPQAEPGNDEL